MTPVAPKFRPKYAPTARSRRVRGAAVAGVVALLSARGALAQVCTPGHSSPAALEAEQSRTSGEKHLDAARAPNLDEKTRALELEAAERQVRSAVDATDCIVPLNLLRLGQALELEGRYLAALAAFGRLIALKQELAKFRIYAEPLRLATQAEADLSRRIASIEIVVRAPGCDEPTALIDGAPASRGPNQRDPGTVKLEASALGCVTQSSFYILRDGANRRLAFVLERTPSSSLATRDAPPNWFQSPTLGLPRWVWVSIGGTALAVAGGYAGYKLFSSNSSDNNTAIPEGTLGRAPLR
jgi:hypothetical protein